MYRRYLVVSVLILVASVSTGCISPIRETPSLVVNSEHFEIFSTMDEEETKALAQGLERFHALIYAVTNAPEVEPAIPTRISAFAKRLEYRKFGPPGTAGVFQAGLRDNQIVLVDYSRRVAASEVILHEYVHFVLRNGQRTQYPLWYDEGFAEFLSTARVHDDVMAVGAFPKARRSAFEHYPWVPLKRIITAGTYSDLKGTDGAMLYPESWALVHYLFLDREPGGVPVATAMTDYLNRVESGALPHDAFRDAFGETTYRASRNIQKILDTGSLRVIGVPLESLDYDLSEPTVRVPAKDETALRFGQLSLRSGKSESAEEQFRSAIAANPVNARAHAGLGDALKFQERFDEAEPHFIRSVELGANDALNHLDLAEFYDDRARSAGIGEERDRLMGKARDAYERSLELDRTIPETWVMLGRTHLAPGEKPALALPLLEKGARMLPSSPFIMNLLAESAVAMGRDRLARRLLVKASAARARGQLERSVDDQIAQIRKQRAEAEAKANDRAAEGS